VVSSRSLVADRVDQHLARDAVEVMGAAGDVEPLVAATSEITAHGNVAESSDLTVEVDVGAALGGVVLVLALTPIAADLVAAVVRIEELFLEHELGAPHDVARDRPRDHAEVMIERSRGGDGEQGGRCEYTGDDELAH